MGCVAGTHQSTDRPVASTMRVSVVARPSFRVVLFRKALFDVRAVGHGEGIDVELAIEAVVLVVAIRSHVQPQVLERTIGDAPRACFDFGQRTSQFSKG